MATSLVDKLRIKEGYKVAMVNVPPECRAYVEPLPANVDVREALDDTFDLIWYFSKKKADFERDLPALRERIKPKGLLWVTYPKGSSKVPTDLNRDIVAAAGVPFGL